MGPKAAGIVCPLGWDQTLPSLFQEAMGSEAPGLQLQPPRHPTRQCVKGRVIGSGAKKPEPIYFHPSVKTASTRLRLRKAPFNLNFIFIHMSQLQHGEPRVSLCGCLGGGGRATSTVGLSHSLQSNWRIRKGVFHSREESGKHWGDLERRDCGTSS